MRSSSGTRIPVRGGGAAVPLRRAPGPRRASQPHPLTLLFARPRFSFSFQPGAWKAPVLLLRGAAGSLPRLPAPGAAALPGRWVRAARRRGCPRCALLKTGSGFRAEPFFFFFLPPFPPSPLPVLPPSLSFPLSLLSLPFSLSLSCIQGWHSEPLCIYVHNKAARPLHFICIITISVQAHHIVCCLHLLLRLLSQSTRLDFHILNELILYQQHTLTSQALGNRAPALWAPQPQPLPRRSLLLPDPKESGVGGAAL